MRPLIYKTIDLNKYNIEDLIIEVLKLAISSKVLDSHFPPNRYMYKGYFPGDFIEALPMETKNKLKELKPEHITQIRI